MSYSEAYDKCMSQKGLPLLGEIFSQKTLSEAIEIFHEIHSALEASGGTEITLAALATGGPALGLSEEGLEVAGLLAAAGANISAQLYFQAAISCLAVAVVKENFLAELDTAPEGFVKDQMLSEARGEGAVA